MQKLILIVLASIVFSTGVVAQVSTSVAVTPASCKTLDETCLDVTTEDLSVVGTTINPLISNQSEASSTAEISDLVAIIMAQVNAQISQEIALQWEKANIAQLSGTRSVDNQADKTIRANEESQRVTTPVRNIGAGEVEMVFGAGIPTLTCSPLLTCVIELEGGEFLTDTFSVSDSARWNVEYRVRDGDQRQIFLLVQPHSDAEQSSLNVFTDRRTYIIKLVPNLYNHTYHMSFKYPDTDANRLAAKIRSDNANRLLIDQATAASDQAQLYKTGTPTDKGFSLASQLNFDFIISGKAKFKPTRIYSDGRLMYIQLPKNYQGEIPAILGPANGKSVAITFDPKTKNLLIVDRVLEKFSLRLGKITLKIRKNR